MLHEGSSLMRTQKILGATVQIVVATATWSQVYVPHCAYSSVFTVTRRDSRGKGEWHKWQRIDEWHEVLTRFNLRALGWKQRRRISPMTTTTKAARSVTSQGAWVSQCDRRDGGDMRRNPIKVEERVNTRRLSMWTDHRHRGRQGTSGPHPPNLSLRHGRVFIQKRRMSSLFNVGRAGSTSAPCCRLCL